MEVFLKDIGRVIFKADGRLHWMIFTIFFLIMKYKDFDLKKMGLNLQIVMS